MLPVESLPRRDHKKPYYLHATQATRNVPFLDQKKLIVALDGISKDDLGSAAVIDLALTTAMSYVFMHEGLGLAS